MATIYNLLDKYEKTIRYGFTMFNYREWLESKGYNVKCEYFTIDEVGNIRCTRCKQLFLCNKRCIHKTN